MRTGGASAARSTFAVMGTVASLTVGSRDVERFGPAYVDQALAQAREVLLGLDRRFSHFQDDSEISRWLRAEPVSVDAAVDIEHVLRECGRLHGDSDGVFEPRDPRTGALDTAGYVKGYAIRCAAEAMLDAGLSDLLVGVGGDVHASGRASLDRPWRAAVQDPRRSHAVVALVDVEDGAVATSGTAQRGAHVWRGTALPVGPEAGAPDALLSFTVLGPDIALADAYATIGLALGADGPAWVRRHEGYRSLVVRADGTVVSDAALVSAA